MLVTMEKVFMNFGDITYVKPLSKIYMLQVVCTVYQKPVSILGTRIKCLVYSAKDLGFKWFSITLDVRG